MRKIKLTFVITVLIFLVMVIKGMSESDSDRYESVWTCFGYVCVRLGNLTFLVIFCV